MPKMWRNDRFFNSKEQYKGEDRFRTRLYPRKNMTKTNCSSCGVEINTEIHPVGPEGHMCFDCHFDYLIANGGYDNYYL